MTAADASIDRVVDHTPPTPVVDLVIPVYNEEAALGGSVKQLVEHLADLPWSWRVTIADNASADGTWELAERLASDVDGLRAFHLPRKGRGGALRAVWSASDAGVLAYTDVDLSTGLAALEPLVAPLVAGDSDIGIGTRLAPGSTVTRGPKREVISRGYNLLLRALVRARFSDAQCGFKAIRADVAHRLLPHLENDSWFFDTELLLLAQRCGLRVHEVPVEWVDDADSRVKIVPTAIEDLQGLARVMWRIGRGTFRA
jgi:glycosyltransferase involved in cell wall biosynthesis